MILGSRNDPRVELSILGYQCPSIVDEQHDANWLMVQARVNADEGQWKFTDPCLLTWEVGWLTEWFGLIGEGDMRRKEIGFLEPVISFQLREWQPDEIVLRVEFCLEGMPPWLQESKEIDEPYPVELRLTAADLRAAASALSYYLERFPPRAGVPDRLLHLE